MLTTLATSKPIVRGLNDQDQRECLEIYVQYLLESPGRRPKEFRLKWAAETAINSFVAEFNSPFYKTIIVEKNGHVAGFTILEFPVIYPLTGDYQLCIRQCHIAKPWRNTRVAKSLWESIEAFAEEKKAEYITYVTANPLVVRMLTKRGFITESVIMAKKR